MTQNYTRKPLSFFNFFIQNSINAFLLTVRIFFYNGIKGICSYVFISSHSPVVALKYNRTKEVPRNGQYAVLVLEKGITI